MIGHPQVTELSDLLLEILQTDGDWMNRREIAERIPRPAARLNPYDVQLLGQLVEDGKAEAEQRKTGAVKKEWFYRAKHGRENL